MADSNNTACGENLQVRTAWKIVESEEISFDHEAAIRAALNASPGVVSISATVRYDDGHFERITVRRPVGPTLTRVK